MELFCHEIRYKRESRNAGNQTSSRMLSHVMSHVKSAVQENTEVMNHIRWWNTALWVKVQILCFLVVIQSASAVKPNKFRFRGIQLQAHGCTPGLDVMGAYAAIFLLVFSRLLQQSVM